MGEAVSKILSSRSYEEVVENDLELIWLIKRYCKARPWIERYMSRIVSKHPMQDICLVLWIAFILGWIEVGHAHFWVCIINATVVLLARRLIEAKRPVEYDRRLRPRTEVNPESYGFPSVETHMAVVIFGHLYLSYVGHHSFAHERKRFAFFATSAFSSAMAASESEEETSVAQWLRLLVSPTMVATLLLVLAVGVCALVGFSRVYSASRFPHQIAASYVTGLVGLLLSRHCCEHMAFHKMRDFEHYSCMLFVLLGVFANVALNMENNDSRLLHIPKREFLRVICDILSSSRTGDAVLAAAASGGDNGGNDADDDQTQRAVLSPRARALREAQDRRTKQNRGGDGFSGTRPRRYVKSDSLFFLQRGMEERERQQAAQQVAGSNDSDRHSAASAASAYSNASDYF